MAQLDPVHERITSFLFPCCQVRLDGADLLVAVQGASLRAGSGAELQWGTPVALSRDVAIECEPGPHKRADRAEYPPEPAYAAPVTLRFRGAVTYGRVPMREGWALLVQAAVRSLGGLPAGEAFVVESAAATPLRASATATFDQGPINGPHLPFP